MDDFDDIGTLDDDMPSPEGLGVEASKPHTPVPAPVKPKVAKSLDFGDIATDDDDLSDLAAKVEASEDQTKEWMRAYGLEHFKLVQDIDVLRAIVDECLAATHFGIDLETEGFDNRIEYGHDLKPQTIHKIVGYCLAVNGTGYYIPIRHAFDPRYGEKDPNIQPHMADPEISRLCWGTQPELGPEDSVFHKLAGPTGKPVACFFNAKFDQEFLFPVTGLDIWHDSSFEDMYLAGYVINSEEGADTGLKEYSERILSFTAKGSDKSVPLKMINFKELFPKEVKPKDRAFKKLYPQLTYSGKPNAVVTYGCSDALCTLFLCLPQDQLPEGVIRSSHFIQDARQPKYLFTYRIEQQTTQAVRVMERSRGLVDKTEILKVQEEAEIELAEIEAKIKQVAAKAGMPDFNPASFPQVAELLYAPDRLDLNPKPEKTSTGQYQTTMSVLEALVEDLGEQAPPVIRWLVIHRQITKAIGTYLTALARDTDDNNCLRYNFKQTGTATGRFTAPKGKTDHG
jgi:DNA polymerase I-like protein with 3'-5' exonuclease and polymerase domains